MPVLTVQKRRELSRKQKHALLALENAMQALTDAGLTDGVISWLDSHVRYDYLPTNLANAIGQEIEVTGRAMLTVQLVDLRKPLNRKPAELMHDTDVAKPSLMNAKIEIYKD